MMGLNEAITIAINGLNAGVVSKEEAKESILDCVDRHYLKISEDLPVNVFQMLNVKFGMTFEINDGKLGGHTKWQQKERESKTYPLSKVGQMWT